MLPFPADWNVAEKRGKKKEKTSLRKAWFLGHSAAFFCSLIAILETTIIAKLVRVKMELEQWLAYNITVLKITTKASIRKRHCSAHLSLRMSKNRQEKRNHCKKQQSESHCDQQRKHFLVFQAENSSDGRPAAAALGRCSPQPGWAYTDGSPRAPPWSLRTAICCGTAAGIHSTCKATAPRPEAHSAVAAMGSRAQGSVSTPLPREILQPVLVSRLWQRPGTWNGHVQSQRKGVYSHILGQAVLC